MALNNVLTSERENFVMTVCGGVIHSRLASQIELSSVNLHSLRDKIGIAELLKIENLSAENAHLLMGTGY